MRKLLFTILAGCAFFLTGCLETIQEVTIKDDGSGTVTTTTDMSTTLSMLKQMSGEEFKKEMPGKLDSSYSLADNIDEMTALSENEKMLMKKGTMSITLDPDNEKLVTKLLIPFAAVAEIPVINAASGKIFSDEIEKKLKQEEKNDVTKTEDSKLSSMDAYFIMEYEPGSIKCKLDSEKYKEVESDEFLKGIKEASAMGVPMKTKYIFNFPRPVEEVEGDVVKLSEDKMKATIEFDIDDFFDNPGKLEYKIKY